MRGYAAALAASAAMVSMAWAQEMDQARPGGVYATVAAPTAQACARACESDSLCMSWTLLAQQGQACELKAVIPPAQFSQGAVSGLSSRAPRLTRLIPLAPAPVSPTQSAEAGEPLLAPPEQQADAMELLGAPEPAAAEAPAAPAAPIEVAEAPQEVQEPLIGDGLGETQRDTPTPMPASMTQPGPLPPSRLPPGVLIVPDAAPTSQGQGQAPTSAAPTARPSTGLRMGR